MLFAKKIKIKYYDDDSRRYHFIVVFSQNKQDSKLMKEYLGWRDSVNIFTPNFVLLLNFSQLIVFIAEKMKMLPKFYAYNLEKVTSETINYLQFTKIDSLPFGMVYDTIQKMILIYYDEQKIRENLIIVQEIIK